MKQHYTLPKETLNLMSLVEFFKKVDCPSIYSFYRAVFSEEFQQQTPKTSSVPLQFNPVALATKAG